MKRTVILAFVYLCLLSSLYGGEKFQIQFQKGKSKHSFSFVFTQHIPLLWSKHKKELLHKLPFQQKNQLYGFAVSPTCKIQIVLQRGSKRLHLPFPLFQKAAIHRILSDKEFWIFLESSIQFFEKRPDFKGFLAPLLEVYKKAQPSNFLLLLRAGMGENLPRHLPWIRLYHPEIAEKLQKGYYTSDYYGWGRAFSSPNTQWLAQHIQKYKPDFLKMSLLEKRHFLRAVFQKAFQGTPDLRARNVLLLKDILSPHSLSFLLGELFRTIPAYEQISSPLLYRQMILWLLMDQLDSSHASANYTQGYIALLPRIRSEFLNTTGLSPATFGRSLSLVGYELYKTQSMDLRTYAFSNPRLAQRAFLISAVSFGANSKVSSLRYASQVIIRHLLSLRPVPIPLQEKRKEELARVLYLSRAIVAELNQSPSSPDFIRALALSLPRLAQYAHLLHPSEVEVLLQELAQCFQKSSYSKVYFPLFSKIGGLDGRSFSPHVYHALKKCYQKHPSPLLLKTMMELLGNWGEVLGFSVKLRQILSVDFNQTNSFLASSSLSTKEKIGLSSILWYRIALGILYQGGGIEKKKNLLSTPALLRYCFNQISPSVLPELKVLENRGALLFETLVTPDIEYHQKAAYHSIAFSHLYKVIAMEREYQKLAWEHQFQIPNSQNKIRERYRKLRKKLLAFLVQNLQAFGAKPSLYRNLLKNHLSKVYPSMIQYLRRRMSHWPDRDERLKLQSFSEGLLLLSRTLVGEKIALAKKTLVGLSPQEFIPYFSFREYREAFLQEIHFLEKLEKYKKDILHQDYQRIAQYHQKALAIATARENLLHTMAQLKLEFLRLEVEGEILGYQKEIALYRYQMAEIFEKITSLHLKISRLLLKVRKLQREKARINGEIAKNNVQIARFLQEIANLESKVIDGKIAISQARAQFLRKLQGFQRQNITLTKKQMRLLAKRWKLALEEKQNIVQALQYAIAIKQQAIHALKNLAKKIIDKVEKKIQKIRGQIQKEKHKSFWSKVISVACKVVGTIAGALLGDPLLGYQLGTIVGDALKAGILDKDWSKAFRTLASGGVKLFLVPKITHAIGKTIGSIDNPLLREGLKQLHLDRIVAGIPSAILNQNLGSYLKSSLLDACRKIPRFAVAAAGQFVWNKTKGVRESIGQFLKLQKERLLQSLSQWSVPSLQGDLKSAFQEMKMKFHLSSNTKKNLQKGLQLLQQDPELRSLKAEIWPIFQKHFGPTKEALKEVIALLKGKKLKSQIIAQIALFSSAAHNLRESFPEYMDMLLENPKEAAKLLALHLKNYASQARSLLVEEMLKTARVLKKAKKSWSDIRRELEKKYRAKIKPITEGEWLSILNTLRMQVDKKLAQILVSQELKDFVHILQRKLRQVEEASSRGKNNLERLRSAQQALEDLKNWLNGPGVAQSIQRIQAQLNKQKQDLANASLQRDITALDGQIASIQSQKDLLQAFAIYQKTLFRICKNQVWRKILVYQKEIARLNIQKARVNLQNAQKALALAKANVKEKEEWLHMAALRLEKSDLKSQIQKKKTTIAKIHLQMAVLRQKALRLQKKKILQQIQWLEAKRSRNELQHALLFATRNHFFGADFSYQELHAIYTQARMRSLFYLQAMRTVLERTFQISLPPSSRMKNPSPPSFTLEEEGNRLNKIRLKRLNKVFCHDIQYDSHHPFFQKLLQKGEITFSLFPRQFPFGRRDAVLVTAEIYFLGSFSYRRPVPLWIHLRGPVFHGDKTSGNIWRVYLNQQWEGYGVRTIPDARVAYQATPFSQGLWYLSPFCRWKIRIDPKQLSEMRKQAKGMLLRIYYSVP